jgi:hypothetical protein
MTVPQQALYKAIIRAVGPEMLIILTRVNLGHLTHCFNEESNYRAQWHHVCRQWIDFVLCNASDFNPVLAIKLETRSERRQRLDRLRTRPDERDITDDILTRTRIPLLRLMAVDDYDFAPVMNEIRRLLLGVLAREKMNNLTPQENTEKIYIKGLDGEVNSSASTRHPPNPSTRSRR